MEKIQVKFKSKDNRNIDAQLVMPIEWNKKVIIHSNGYTVSYKDDNRIQDRWFDMLANDGYKVVRYDYIGYGDSEGEFRDSIPSGMISDLISVINQIDNDEVTEIILMGISLGGLVTKQVIDTYEHSKIHKCVLLCPAIDIANMRRNKKKLSSPLFSWDDKEYLNKFKEDIFKYKDLIEQHNPNVEYLFIHGQKDDVVPIDGSRKYKLAFGDNVNLVEIPNADHNIWSVRRSIDEIDAMPIQEVAFQSLKEFILI